MFFNVVMFYRFLFNFSSVLLALYESIILFDFERLEYAFLLQLSLHLSFMKNRIETKNLKTTQNEIKLKNIFAVYIGSRFCYNKYI